MQRIKTCLDPFPFPEIGLNWCSGLDPQLSAKAFSNSPGGRYEDDSDHLARRSRSGPRGKDIIRRKPSSVTEKIRRKNVGGSERYLQPLPRDL